MKISKNINNQFNQAWRWQSLMAAAFLVTVVASNAFANANACINPSEIIFDGHLKIKFCDIPAAQDVMIGSENGDSDEKPAKARNFKKFQISQFEVTQLQYKSVMLHKPWIEHGKLKDNVQIGDDYPAVYVSYNDAQDFVQELDRRMGLEDVVEHQIPKTATYRLPTEAEYEYAARAGTTTDYYWGDSIAYNFAYFWGNFNNNAQKVDSCPDPILSQKNPGYCANGFGLYHMAGNVSEWTADAYVNSYANAPTNGNVAVYGDSGSFRVVRGGGWYSNEYTLRSSDRQFVAPDVRDSSIGFRIVRIAN